MRIAIVGAGATGSVYAGLLADAGHQVWAVGPWQEHIEAIRTRGLRVSGASGDRVAWPAATTDPREIGPVELVVIATKAGDVEQAARAALDGLERAGAPGRHVLLEAKTAPRPPDPRTPTAHDGRPRLRPERLRIP